MSHKAYPCKQRTRKLDLMLRLLCLNRSDITCVVSFNLGLKGCPGVLGQRRDRTKSLEILILSPFYPWLRVVPLLLERASQLDHLWSKKHSKLGQKTPQYPCKSVNYCTLKLGR